MTEEAQMRQGQAAGSMKVNDLEAVLNKLGMQPTKEELENMIAIADPNGTG